MLQRTKPRRREPGAEWRCTTSRVTVAPPSAGRTGHASPAANEATEPVASVRPQARNPHRPESRAGAALAAGRSSKLRDPISLANSCGDREHIAQCGSRVQGLAAINEGLL